LRGDERICCGHLPGVEVSVHGAFDALAMR
jgi:hypothetical protein